MSLNRNDKDCLCAFCFGLLVCIQFLFPVSCFHHQLRCVLYSCSGLVLLLAVWLMSLVLFLVVPVALCLLLFPVILHLDLNPALPGACTMKLD